MPSRAKPKEIGCRRLPDRVSVQRDSGAQDAAGQPTEAWANLLSGQPALIDSMGGNEVKNYAQMVSTATHAVTMRNNLIVTQNMRVLVGRSRVAAVGAVLNIEAIERRADSPGWMKLICRELT